MYYYVKNKKKIEKYYVEVDKNQLRDLREVIKENHNDLNEIDDLIEELLIGTDLAVNNLLKYENCIKQQIKKTDKSIEKFNKNEKNFSTDNIKKYHEKLITSDSLWFKKNKLNEEMKCLRKINSLISFKLESIISIKEINEVIKFLDIDNEPEYGKVKIKNKMIDKKNKK